MALLPDGRWLALVLAFPGLSACGPDSGDQLTAGEYRERGNRICREAERDARSLERAGFRAQLERSADAAEEYQRRFEELEPPDELADEHRRAVGHGREVIQLLRRAEQAVEAGDRGEVVEVLGELERIVREGNATSRELGLTDCVAGEL
jgi:hypothetical protein